ncbi:phosphoglycerate kinase [soil metagenome]
MGFWKRTVREYDLQGKRVLVRVDYNVPIADDGYITDDYRIQQSLPTLQYLLEQGCSIVLCSHLGRPDGPDDESCSLRPVAERLAVLFNREVKFAKDCIGESTQGQVSNLQPGDILLLENLRYHDEEEANDDNFAKQLAEHGEVFVQDGFGVVHRAHASTDAIAHFLPSVAGLLLEKEVGTIADVMSHPDRPLMAVVGGAKVSDKIDILNRFIDIADIVAIGGAMANIFLYAKGVAVGKSKMNLEDVPLAEQIIEKAEQKARKTNFVLYIPQDGVVARGIDSDAKTRIVDWGSHVIADIESYPKKPQDGRVMLGENEMILDIGPYSGAFIAGAIQLVQTVIWNGAMGVTETKGLQGPIGPFSHGTETVVEAMLGQFGNRPFSLVGGGDTVGYIQNRGLIDAFNHVSTGGGASLELMSGKSLPGVQALWDKE